MMQCSTPRFEWFDDSVMFYPGYMVVSYMMAIHVVHSAYTVYECVQRYDAIDGKMIT